MTNVTLDTFDGHLVLLCKGHYVGKNDFFKAIVKFWSVRCGMDMHFFDSSDRVFENIADTMFKIMNLCAPEKMMYFHEVLHREIATNNKFGTKPKNMSHIKAIVWEYRNFILQLQVKESSVRGRKTIIYINLPKPQKRIIERICNGQGKYEDYELLTKKDKRCL